MHAKNLFFMMGIEMYGRLGSKWPVILFTMHLCYAVENYVW